jgi:pimeloyl-ACP methyl ester carboxylesterase
VLAAIHGACIGGGIDLITACDMRYCSANAWFSVREIDVGMTADVGTLQRLPILIGEGMARELAYTGRRVDGAEAREMRPGQSLFRHSRGLAQWRHGNCPQHRRQVAAGHPWLQGDDHLRPRPQRSRRPELHRDMELGDAVVEGLVRSRRRRHAKARTGVQGLMEHFHAPVNGIRLHCVADGAPEAPLMLFVHGFPEFWYCWKQQLAEFGRDYRAVAFDLRGHNLSDKPEGIAAYRIKPLLEDLRQLIEHLTAGRADKSCVLVAHDWGGAIAWTFAAAYPAYVKRLVIINAPAQRSLCSHAGPRPEATGGQRLHELLSSRQSHARDGGEPLRAPAEDVLRHRRRSQRTVGRGHSALPGGLVAAWCARLRAQPLSRLAIAPADAR